MSQHIIECCFVNRLNGSEDIFAELEKSEKLSVHTFSCIGNCHHCATTAHCIFNGERLQAATPQQLFEKILQKLT